MIASSTRWPGILFLVFLVVLATLAVVLQKPPRPVPADALPERFSAMRAFEHVQAIAREPHPTGSPANAAVRDYLLAELSQLGLSPRVQDTVVQGTRIQNVLGRLQGSQPGDQAVMLGRALRLRAIRPGGGRQRVRGRRRAGDRTRAERWPTSHQRRHFPAHRW